MIAREHALPIRGQLRLIDLASSTFYYEPKALSQSDIELMKLIVSSGQSRKSPALSCASMP
jgi:hypothetical protein